MSKGKERKMKICGASMGKKHMSEILNVQELMREGMNFVENHGILEPLPADGILVTEDELLEEQWAWTESIPSDYGKRGIGGLVHSTANGSAKDQERWDKIEMDVMDAEEEQKGNTSANLTSLTACHRERCTGCEYSSECHNEIEDAA